VREPEKAIRKQEKAVRKHKKEHTKEHMKKYTKESVLALDYNFSFVCYVCFNEDCCLNSTV
jgi:hypothetical protein